MSNGDEKLIKQIILDAIRGKNKALHAYDRMIWTIRTGFLTLLFSGWGLLLSFIGKDIQKFPKLAILIPVMFFVSVALAFGGFLIDKNYVRRKFRVIFALNRLMELLSEYSEDKVLDIEFRSGELKELLKISGDSASKNYREVDGYSGARLVSLIIFLMPIISVGLGSLIFFLFRTP